MTKEVCQVRCGKYIFFLIKRKETPSTNHNKAHQRYIHLSSISQLNTKHGFEALEAQGGVISSASAGVGEVFSEETFEEAKR